MDCSILGSRSGISPSPTGIRFSQEIPLAGTRTEYLREQLQEGKV